MTLFTYKNSDELAGKVADLLVQCMHEALQEKQYFTLVLSGGSTPKKLYELLASDTYKNKIEWNRIHIFFGDERFVPFNDERNNANMAYKSLLNHVNVLSQNIHIMQTEDVTPEQSAHNYDAILNKYFSSSNNLQTFDLVLLGIGDDAHTLSLFPGNEDVILEEERWCTSLWVENQNMYRITLTAQVVNKSARVAFLVTGSSKADALQEVLNGKYNPVSYPSQIIKPTNGELVWFVDEPAASKL